MRSVAGKTVAIIGEPSKLWRDEAALLLTLHGAIVTRSLSSKTEIAFVGKKPGTLRAKAKHFHVELVPESELYELLRIRARSRRPRDASYAKYMRRLAGLARSYASAERRRKRRAREESALVPIDLKLLGVRKPRSVSELSALEQRQLRLGAKAYDGHDLPASARFANDGRETSFRGTIEYRTIGDTKKKPLYDAVLYAGDAGVIYARGTTKPIAWVGQARMVTLHGRHDLALQRALQDAVQRARRAK